MLLEGGLTAVWDGEEGGEERRTLLEGGSEKSVEGVARKAADGRECSVFSGRVAAGGLNVVSDLLP
jgi:hypothetical protein